MTLLQKQILTMAIVVPASSMAKYFNPNSIPFDSNSILTSLQANIQHGLQHGLTFRPVEESLKDVLAWWSAHVSKERKDKPGFGLSAEREAELLSAWHSR